MKLPCLTTRTCVAERMDDPGCPEDLLLNTVRQFDSINRLLSRYRSMLKRWVLADMQLEPERDYHLVDMGAGGCDIDVWLLKEAQSRGLRLKVTALDLDPRIVDYAIDRCGPSPELTIQHANVLLDPIPEGVDYVFANHFLHHLSNDQIVALIKRWAPHVERRLLFSDLYRTTRAYVGYALVSRLYRNSFAREDGLASIRRGFLPGELHDLATSAGQKGRFWVDTLVPGRLVLRINGEPQTSVAADEKEHD